MNAFLPPRLVSLLFVVACAGATGCSGSSSKPAAPTSDAEQTVPEDLQITRPVNAPAKLAHPEREQRKAPIAEAPVAAPLPKEIANSLAMKLVLIPAGRFIMGSPPAERDRGQDETAHEVEIGRPFYLGVFEVTQSEYEQVMKTNPSHFAPKGAGAEQVKGMDTRRLPVDSVSWKDAVEFCRRLSELPEEKVAGRVYRLPTEAEWEYACRANAGSQPFHFGPSLSSTQANFDGSLPYGGAPKGPSLQRPAPVGSYPPNALGLHDLHGNVWEWCADWYQPDHDAAASGLHRVMRGGCFLSAGSGCRTAVRGQAEPNSRSLCVGFRVAMDPAGP